MLSVLLGSLGSTGCLIGAFWALRRKRLIDDVPTSTTKGIFIGLAELKGTAESESPLTSYVAGTRCVQYDWRIEEQWSRTIHETYTDSNGHTRTRTRTESGWTRVAGEKQAVPFYLKDDTGIIRIVPDGAAIEGITTFNDTVTRESSLYFGKGPGREVADSTHKRRFTETALPLHTPLYVMGQARERQDIIAAEIADDKDTPVFLITTRTEKHVSNRYGWWFALWLFIGLAAALGGVVFWSRGEAPSTGPTWPALAVTAGAFFTALSLGWAWTLYNSLVHLKNMVEQGWSQVDVQLKRRHDLIPNLVTTVEAYRNHEAETPGALAELRSQADATPPGVGGPDFTGLAPRLVAIVERYPGLKANDSFLRLQQTLVDTEHRISLARDYFNNIATFYNTRLEVIPDRFVAAQSKLRPRTLMSAAGFERAPLSPKLTE